MLLHLALTMDSLLPAAASRPELSLQLIFFDGEDRSEYLQWICVGKNVF